MRSTRVLVLAAAILLLVGVQVWAHHAFASEFDVNKPVHLTGTVTKLELVNPHAWIYVDVKDASGKVNNWAFECGASPNILIRRGFTRASLPIGSEVIVDGFQAKDATMKASGSNLTLADGRKVFIGSGNAGEGPPPEESKK
jgi:uncharacterized protein DUF6152